jgi:hypothetical protein
VEGGDGFYVSARRVALNFPGYGIAKMGHRSSLHSEKCSPASRRASPSPPRATDSREMSRALRPTPVTRARSGVGGFSQARHGRDASHASCAAWKARKGISGKRFVGFHARRDRVTSLQRARSSNSDSRSEDSDIESMVDIESIKAMLEDDPEVKAQERKIANTARDAASLQVDARMAEARDEIAYELANRSSKVSELLINTQTEALVEFELRSAAVLKAEAEVIKIAEERKALEAEANERGYKEKKKWGSTVSDDVDENAERVESAKAGSISAIAGTALSTPLLLAQSGDNLFVSLSSVGGVFVSCLLFGVVTRYATRDDLGNDQLRLGVLGAFGLTRGLGEVDVYLHGSDTSQISTYAEAGLLLAESLLPFAFAAAALDWGFKNELVRPFPMRRKKY